MRSVSATNSKVIWFLLFAKTHDGEILTSSYVISFTPRVLPTSKRILPVPLPLIPVTSAPLTPVSERMLRENWFSKAKSQRPTTYDYNLLYFFRIVMKYFSFTKRSTKNLLKNSIRYVYIWTLYNPLRRQLNWKECPCTSYFQFLFIP